MALRCSSILLATWWYKAGVFFLIIHLFVVLYEERTLRLMSTTITRRIAMRCAAGG